MSYTRQQQIIEEMNYQNDPRTQAGGRGDWYKSFDEANMTATVAFTCYDDDGEEVEEVVSFPVRLEACNLCNGKGSHVNPSIDCGGLTQDDFDEDPDFEESYRSGHYDVTCNQCHGKRAVPVINHDHLNDEQKRALNTMNQLAEEEAAYQAECRMERMMGC